VVHTPLVQNKDTTNPSVRFGVSNHPQYLTTTKWSMGKIHHDFLLLIVEWQ